MKITGKERKTFKRTNEKGRHKDEQFGFFGNELRIDRKHPIIQNKGLYAKGLSFGYNIYILTD